MEKKQLLVVIDESMHKALGHLAIERGTSKAALVREFLKAGLAQSLVPAPPVVGAVEAREKYRALTDYAPRFPQGSPETDPTAHGNTSFFSALSGE